MVENANLAATKVTRECTLCGFVTEENMVVCPEDGSALMTNKPDPLVGKVIAEKFEIVSLVGSGGMGNVYKALQQPVGRHVALKVLHSERLRKGDSVRRFQQEAKAAAALSHANIVGFFDYGLTEDNIPFIVMDFVDGLPLDEALKRDGTLSVERCVEIFGQACDALEHAHSKGIIHRDIKPSNLMLMKNDEGREHVKILDFGIAKLLPSDGQISTLTQTGEVFGSPQYMSPEQCNGTGMDARSDIYSLGCVMYEALLGKPPLTGDSLIGTIYKHTNEQPAPFKTVRPDLEIPAQLEALVLKALEKDPAMRFPSMSVLKRNLEFVHVFAKEEKDAPPEKAPIAVAAGKWRVPLASAGVLLLLGGAGYGYYATNPEAQLAVLEALNGSHSDRLVAPTRQLRDSLSREGHWRDAFSYALKAVSLSKENHPGTMDEATDLLAAADILVGQKDDRAREYFQQAREDLRKLAENNRHQQRWQDNSALDERIASIDKTLGETDDAGGIADQLGQADDMRLSGNIDQAAPVYEKLLSQKKKMSAEQKATIFSALSAVAAEQAIRGQGDKAEANYKAGIALGAEVYGAGKPEVLKVKRALGLHYHKTSQYSSAEKLLTDTLAEASSTLGESSQMSLQLLEDLAKLYDDMREVKTAREMRDLAEKLKAERQ